MEILRAVKQFLRRFTAAVASSSNLNAAICRRRRCFGLMDVYAATIPGLKFQPGVHVNYAETVLPVRDGLPKFKDFPAQMGGSGQMLPE